MFGERLRLAREKAGLSQEELAIKAGYSNKGSISKIESGKADVYRAKVQEFADILGVSVAYLMGWDVMGTENAERSTYYLDPGTREIAEEIHNNKELSLLFDAARDASPEDLETAHTILKALKDKENKNDWC